MKNIFLGLFFLTTSLYGADERPINDLSLFLKKTELDRSQMQRVAALEKQLLEIKTRIEQTKKEDDLEIAKTQIQMSTFLAEVNSADTSSALIKFTEYLNEQKIKSSKMKLKHQEQVDALQQIIAEINRFKPACEAEQKALATLFEASSASSSEQ